MIRQRATSVAAEQRVGWQGTNINTDGRTPVLHTVDAAGDVVVAQLRDGASTEVRINPVIFESLCYL